MRSAPAVLALAAVLWALPTAGLAQLVQLVQLVQLAQLAQPGTDKALPSAALGERTLALSSLAATCATCHGTHGVSAPGASVTSLARLDPAYIA